MKMRYDKPTDSLYVEVRPLPSRRTVGIEEDIMLDLGADGEPVGYDIQHASKHPDVIAEAWRHCAWLSLIVPRLGV